MEVSLKELSRKRLSVIAANLVYFLLLLVVGVALFLVGIGPAGYVVAAVLLAVYLLVVRPMSRRYVQQVRRAILTHATCAGLDHFTYQPKEGVSQRKVQTSGLFPASTDRAFLSRELIQGQAGDIQVELADVTFPIVENGRNAMFNGCYIRLTCPNVRFIPLRVEGNAIPDLPKREQELIKQLGAVIPNSRYLKMEGEHLEILLRGRFLGYRINPLMPIDRQTLTCDPLPELGQALQLVRLHQTEQN